MFFKGITRQNLRNRQAPLTKIEFIQLSWSRPNFKIKSRNRKIRPNCPRPKWNHHLASGPKHRLATSRKARRIRPNERGRSVSTVSRRQTQKLNDSRTRGEVRLTPKANEEVNERHQSLNRLAEYAHQVDWAQEQGEGWRRPPGSYPEVEREAVLRFTAQGADHCAARKGTARAQSREAPGNQQDAAAKTRKSRFRTRTSRWKESKHQKCES